MEHNMLQNVSRNALVTIYKSQWGDYAAYVVHNGMAILVASGSAPNHVWRKAHFKGFHNFRYIN